MNVLALVPVDSTIEGVVVPGPAIVWWQGHAWVYVRTNPSTFARRGIAACIAATALPARADTAPTASVALGFHLLES